MIIICTFFIFPLFSTLMLLGLGTVVDDELIVDLDTATLMHLVQCSPVLQFEAQTLENDFSP